jgi:hypothetical protein
LLVEIFANFVGFEKKKGLTVDGARKAIASPAVRCVLTPSDVEERGVQERSGWWSCSLT